MSDDLWFPWEMLWLRGNGKKCFLGEHFAVTRGKRIAASWPMVGRGPTILVAPHLPDQPLLPSTAERNALIHLTGAPPDEAKTVLQVQERLHGNEPVSVLHFACHGKADFDDDQLLGGWLALERGSLRPIDVQQHKDNALLGSLVFVNACESDVSTKQLFGHGGWIEAFLGAGAAVVVAPSWAVYTHTASTLAVRFYSALAGGATFGEAGRLARIAARESGNPDRLAYAIYADAGARFEPPVAAGAA